MNLASRPGPTGSGTSHPGLPAVSSNMVSVTNAPPCNHIPNANAGKAGPNNLMNLYSLNLTVPRQMTVQARGAQSNQHVLIHLNFVGTIGQGTFGQIERATLTLRSESGGESKYTKSEESCPLQVAVKRVLQDPRYKNRELSIMQRLSAHPNVVKFYYYYYSTTPSTNRGPRGSSGRSGSSTSGLDLFLHLVLECFPESLCELICRYVKCESKIPTHMVKIFTYQMLKALAYLHSHQICHRDIKSSNLLVDESTLVLKVCDFGSAKEMVPGVTSVSYISSRYYRAPELLFGSQLYTCAIDTWSGGCVLAEMLRQRCLFMGADSIEQLVTVIRVLGTPSLGDIASMNPFYRSYNLPKVKPCPVSLFFPQHTPTDLLNLMQTMLVFNPTLRVSPLDALRHHCFNELRDAGPNGLLHGRIRLPPHLLDPNPDPSCVVNHTDSSSPATAPNSNWTQQDPRSWLGSSNRKSSDTSTDEKKMKKNGGKSYELPRQPSNAFTSEKSADNLTENKGCEGALSAKKSISKRGDDQASKRLNSDLDKSAALNNGSTGDMRNPTGSSSNQSFKFGLLSAATSEPQEVDQLTEMPS